VDTEGLLTLRFNMSIKGTKTGSTSDNLQKDHLRLTLKAKPSSDDRQDSAHEALTRIKSWRVEKSREAEMGIRVEFEEP
jgi:hypothetical protein